MSEATEDHQPINLQHPSLPADLAEQSDATLQATLTAAAAAAAAAQQQQEQNGAGHHHDTKTEQDGTEQASNETNFFDYSFPNTTTALEGDGNHAQSSFPFATHPQQHPHLGVEALGHAAAASEHIPGVSSAEADGSSHVYDETNGDQTMEMTMTTNAEDSMNDAQQERSSGKAERNSLSVAASDGEGKKNTPYSRSPDMRNSHKLAERKRRKEMKDLFDELRDEIPNERGPKTSKWEILQKAVDYVRALRKERDEFASELAGYRGEVVQQDEAMGAEEPQPPPAAPEEDADEYAKYQEQQAASQQQLEAAAAAANQFYEGEPTHQEEGQEAAEQGTEANAEQNVEHDWSALAQVAQAQAQAQTAQ